MKREMKISPRIAPGVKLKTILAYIAASVALFGVMVWLVFLYLNVGKPGDAVANNLNFHSRQSGNWTAGTTWNGGSAPSTSTLNRDNVIINSNHTVTLDGILSINNAVSITINGNGKLVINGDLDVKNDLTMMINGELVVNGNINISNGARITVNGSGRINTSGNIDIKNNSNFYVDGIVNVGGDLSFDNNATFRGNGQVNVVGSGCSRWTGNGICRDNIVLPVELINFDLQIVENNIEVRWKTASEINNDYFSVERSSDGINYTVIGKVEGRGTTKEISSYVFIDESPMNGRTYYRLVQTDYDNSQEIFSPKFIETEVASMDVFNIYPNPLQGTTVNLVFSKPEKGIIEVLDSRGHRVATEDIDGIRAEQQFILKNHIEPGLYYVNFKSASGTRTVKLVKQ